MCLWCLRSAYSWDPRLHSTQKGNVVIEKVCIFFVEPGKLSFFDQKKHKSSLIGACQPCKLLQSSPPLQKAFACHLQRSNPNTRILMHLSHALAGHLIIYALLFWHIEGSLPHNPPPQQAKQNGLKTSKSNFFSSSVKFQAKLNSPGAFQPQTQTLEIHSQPHSTYKDLLLLTASLLPASAHRESLICCEKKCIPKYGRFQH